MAVVRAGRRGGLPAPFEPPGPLEIAAPDHPLFAYGTLADSAFVARLLERTVAAEPAELLDFLRLEPAGFGYPVVFAAAGERAAGVLYRRLTAEDWRRIDAYEGVGEGLYFRDLARVEASAAAPAGSAEAAWVYLPTARTVERFAR